MTYDINIMGNPEVTEAALRIDGTAISGIHKLVQKTLILMYTDVADPYNLGVGTDLPETDRSRNVSDLEGLRGVFIIALNKVKAILISESPLDLPDDERIKEYGVVTSQGSSGEVILDIRVTAQSGDVAEVRAPISLPEIVTG